jgi:AcrR family transcriptional regulator
MTHAERHRGTGDPEPKAALGRPRDADVDARIRAATRSLLAEVGYNRLSFEMLAQACAITRPTIYRRWQSKAHLVFEATLPDSLGGIEDTGDLVADLRDFVSSIASMFAEPAYRAALPGLLTDFAGSPDYEQTVMGDLWTTVRTGFATRIANALDRGEIAGGVDPLDVLDVIIGTLYQRITVLQEPHDDQVERLTRIGLLLCNTS